MSCGSIEVLQGMDTKGAPRIGVMQEFGLKIRSWCMTIMIYQQVRRRSYLVLTQL